MGDAAVRLSPRARQDLEGLSADVAGRLSVRLEQLKQASDPRGDTIKRMAGMKTPTFRLRMGDYWAVFQRQEGEILILRIVHRSQLDRALEEL